MRICKPDRGTAAPGLVVGAQVFILRFCKSIIRGGPRTQTNRRLRISFGTHVLGSISPTRIVCVQIGRGVLKQ